MKDLPSKEHYCNKIHIILIKCSAYPPPPVYPPPIIDKPPHPSPPLFTDNRPYMDYLPQFY